LGLSNTTVERRSQSAKQYRESTVTDGGIEMDFSRLHRRKVSFSIRDNCEPLSNVTDQRISQEAKARAPTVRTEEGMQIDLSNEPQNADFSMHERTEPLSKVAFNIVWMSWNSGKRHILPMVSTEDGTQMEIGHAKG
jgi:hypothetical protein